MKYEVTDMTTPEGQVLLQVLNEIKAMKSQEDKVDSLKNRVDDQEKSITIMAKSTESINKTLDDFLRTMKHTEEKTIDIAMKNQETMMEIKNAISLFTSIESRIAKVENNQVLGCPSSLGARDRIALELKHTEEKMQILATANGKNRDEINELHTMQDVQKEKIVVANNRIGDLEKFQEGYEKWKESLYWKLIVGAAGVILALIGTIFNMIKN